MKTSPSPLRPSVSPETVAECWSDWDGTGVKTPSFNRRALNNHPFRGQPGYASFLEGVRTEGIDPAGIVSRRPDNLLFRKATDFSVSWLGLRDFFPDNRNIHLTGSENRKSQFLIGRSILGPVGMLEDRPHNLGKALLEGLGGLHPSVAPYPITVGAVRHEQTTAHMEDLMTTALDMGLDVHVSRDHDLTVVGENYTVNVVPLRPYSHYEGQAFADRVHANVA